MPWPGIFDRLVWPVRSEVECWKLCYRVSDCSATRILCSSLMDPHPHPTGGQFVEFSLCRWSFGVFYNPSLEGISSFKSVMANLSMVFEVINSQYRYSIKINSSLFLIVILRLFLNFYNFYCCRKGTSK